MTNKLATFLLLLIALAFIYADNGKQGNIGLQVGEEAPTFYLRDLQGNDIFLRDFCGKALRKPWKNKEKYAVVLSFFATWCVPCQKEIPLLHEIQQKYKDKNLKIILIDVGEKKEKVAPFIKEKGYTLPVLLDKYNVVAKKKYKVFALPHLFIIDQNGIIRLVKLGFKDREHFEKIVIPVLDSLLETSG